VVLAGAQCKRDVQDKPLVFAEHIIPRFTIIPALVLDRQGIGVKKEHAQFIEVDASLAKDLLALGLIPATRVVASHPLDLHGYVDWPKRNRHP
jgi:hypothetical protein